MIDLRLEQLERARAILTANHEDLHFPDLVEETAAPAQAEQPVEDVIVAALPKVKKPRKSRAPRAFKPAPAVTADALSGTIPDRPVFVAASNVKARVEHHPAPVAQNVKPIAAEGTLESLIRDLTRPSHGFRLHSAS